MARPVPIASLLALLSAPAMAQPAANGVDWRIPVAKGAASNYSLQTPKFPDQSGRDLGLWAGTRLTPNATLGFGMFGPKRDRAVLAPATGHELNEPRSRRVGAGFRLRF